MKFESIVPTITAHSLHKAKEFYAHLGFSVDWMWPDDKPTHLSLSWDGVSFMVQNVEEASSIHRADLYFRVAGVRELHNSMSQKLDSLPDLIKTDYGMLDFSIDDPWGHKLTFGEPDGEWEG